MTKQNNNIPPYREGTEDEIKERQEKVCELSFRVFRALRHNNIWSTGINDLRKALIELFEFEDDGKPRLR